MSADLEVDGETFHVERVIECKPKFVRTSSFEFQPAWYQGRYVISQAREDGSGIMVVAPTVCARNAPIKLGYDPVVVRVDNTSHPTRLDAYYDVSRLRAGDYRVKLVNVAVESPSQSQQATDSVNDFADWSISLLRDPHPAWPSELFQTCFVFVLPQGVWQEDAAVVQQLATYSKPTILPRPMAVKLGALFPDLLDQPYRDSGWYPTSAVPSLDRIAAAPRFHAADAYGLLKRSGANVEFDLNLDRSHAGVLTYFDLGPVKQPFGIWVPERKQLLAVHSNLSRILLKP